MGKILKESTDNKALVDAYIANATDFAKPICKKLRALAFKADPQIKEVIKWGTPVYEKNGLLFWIAAFKEHVSVMFYNGASMKDTKKILTEGTTNKNGRTVKFYDKNEVDEKIMLAYFKEAASINP